MTSLSPPPPPARALPAPPAPDEATLRQMVEHLPVLAWTAGPDGVIDFYNSRVSAFTGASPAELHMRGWPHLHAPEVLPEVLARWEASLAHGTPFELEHPLRGADGSYRWFLTRVVPLHDAQGRVTRWFGTATDVDVQHRARSAEARLRESETRFRNMADHSPVMLWVTDTTGACVYINRLWCDFTGQTEQEALGLGWLEAVHPEDRALAKEAFLGANATRASFQAEYRLRRHDGQYRWALDSAHPRFGPDGEYLGYIGSVIDISTRKRAEVRVHLLSESSRLLAEHLATPEAVLQGVARLAASTVATFCIVDLVEEDGTTRRAAMAHRTPEGAALLEQVRGFPPRLDGPSEASEALRDGQPRLMEDFDAAARTRLAAAPAHRALLDALDPLSVMLLPVHAAGRVLGLVSLAAAAPLPRFTREDLELGEELAQRTAAALENARLYREAQAAVRLRDEFLSVASHELKTPLTPLQLRLQSLKRDAQGMRPGHVPRTRVVKGLETAEAQVRKLAALVNALLDVSRLTQGRLTLQPEDGVDVAALVAECAAALAQEAERAGCALQVHAPAPVVGSFDRLRLEQVVHNLLSNALKYGAGQPVRVAVERAGASVRLEVRDGGIGIAAEALPRLFGKFERAVSERHYGGMGLGLYITRQIVEAMGGRVRVESAPGRGALFEVVLPLG